jgi:hypothetical protein
VGWGAVQSQRLPLAWWQTTSGTAGTALRDGGRRVCAIIAGSEFRSAWFTESHESVSSEGERLSRPRTARCGRGKGAVTQKRLHGMKDRKEANESQKEDREAPATAGGPGDSTPVRESKCPTNLIPDAPSTDDVFGSHRAIADAIERLIRAEPGGISIALEGKRGAGKTTIINSMARRFEEAQDFAFVVFDAWAHQGDPLRRAFLESVILELQRRGWVDKAHWDEEREVMARRREVTTTRNIPSLSAWGKRLLLSLFLVPFGLSLFTDSLRRSVTFALSPDLPFATAFAVEVSLGILLSLAPAIAYLFAARGRWSGSEDQRNEGAHVLWVFFNKTSPEVRTEVQRSPTLTSIEFEQTFARLVEEAFTDGSRRGLVLALDNLDRVSGRDAL